MPSSRHLANIVNNNYGSASLQVVFSDIEKYSLRKSTTQREVVDKFTELASSARRRVSELYVEYAQSHDLNFSNDIINIPTGDGLAVVFSFDGLERIHLDFAENILEMVHDHNVTNDCAKFVDNGWCNCHDSMRVRVGIASGKGIVYLDINEAYNVAGNSINLAARVMGQVDGMQIALTEDAYETLIDMTTDTDLEEQFRRFENIRLKHGLRADIYQYCPSAHDFVDSGLPKDLDIQVRMQRADELVIPNFSELDEEAMRAVSEVMITTMEQMRRATSGEDRPVRGEKEP